MTTGPKYLYATQHPLTGKRMTTWAANEFLATVDFIDRINPDIAGRPEFRVWVPKVVPATVEAIDELLRKLKLPVDRQIEVDDLDKALAGKSLEQRISIKRSLLLAGKIER